MTSMPTTAELEARWQTDRILADIRQCTKLARKALKEADSIKDCYSPAMAASHVERCDRIIDAARQLRDMVLRARDGAPDA